MPKIPPYRAFETGFSGLSRELVSEVMIAGYFTKKTRTVYRAIWDTGATSCMIHDDIAKDMGLKVLGQRPYTTSGGTAMGNIHVLNIGFISKVGFERVIALSGDLGDGTDLLIGMDIISQGDFMVQNCAGKTHFGFCMPPFKNKYNMIQMAKKFNLQNAQNTFRKVRRKP